MSEDLIEELEEYAKLEGSEAGEYWSAFEELLASVDKYKPPQSWYDNEEEDPCVLWQNMNIVY